MTMHLVRGMSTVNTRKRKTKKLTLTQIAKFEQDMRAHNKKMRQIQAHDLQMNLQEYIDYCHGKYTPKAQKNAEGRDFKPLKSVDQPYQRETPYIPSLSNGMHGFAPKKEPNKYTGTLIKGIATMHKSNAVPIIDKKQAEEISNMRRN